MITPINYDREVNGGLTRASQRLVLATGTFVKLGTSYFVITDSGREYRIREVSGDLPAVFASQELPLAEYARAGKRVLVQGVESRYGALDIYTSQPHLTFIHGL